MSEIKMTCKTKQHRTFWVRHTDQNISLIVDKRERLMDFFLPHTGPEGRDISARLQPFNNKDSHFGLQTSGRGLGRWGRWRGDPEGRCSRWPVGLTALVDLFSLGVKWKGPPVQVLPRVPVGWGGGGGEGRGGEVEVRPRQEESGGKWGCLNSRRRVDRAAGGGAQCWPQRSFMLSCLASCSGKLTRRKTQQNETGGEGESSGCRTTCL